MTSRVEHRRTEDRVEAEETIFIEALASMDHVRDSVLLCTSVNLSQQGLQVLTDEELAPGTILRLCVDLKDDQPIFLVAEARWHRPDKATGGYRTGFRIFESEDTDIGRWHQHIRSCS